MSRIRTIKPELPGDERVGKVSRDARLLWVMCFTLADDEGRFRAHPALLAGSCFPYDGLTPDEVTGWMNELVVAGLLDRYESDGQLYACIPNWSKHQRIDHPTPSKLPAPPEVEILGLPEYDSEKIAKSSRGLAKDRASRASSPIPSIPIPSIPGPRTPRSRARRAGSAEVELVFEAWKEAVGKNGATKLTADRERKIKARLAEGFPVEDLLDAVRGVVKSAWHVEHSQTELTLVLRDGTHLERFRDIGRGLVVTGHGWAEGVNAQIERGLQMVREEKKRVAG